MRVNAPYSILSAGAVNSFRARRWTKRMRVPMRGIRFHRARRVVVGETETTH